MLKTNIILFLLAIFHAVIPNTHNNSTVTNIKLDCADSTSTYSEISLTPEAFIGHILLHIFCLIHYYKSFILFFWSVFK